MIQHSRNLSGFPSFAKELARSRLRRGGQMPRPQPQHLPLVRFQHLKPYPSRSTLSPGALSLPSLPHFTTGSSSTLGCSASCGNLICPVFASFPVSFATTPPLF